VSLRRILEDRKTFILKEPLIKRSWGEHSMTISRMDLARISRNLQYFSSDLMRMVHEAERRGGKVVLHRTLGRMGTTTAEDIASKAMESSEKIEKLIDMMV